MLRTALGAQHDRRLTPHCAAENLKKKGGQRNRNTTGKRGCKGTLDRLLALPSLIPSAGNAVGLWVGGEDRSRSWSRTGSSRGLAETPPHTLLGSLESHSSPFIQIWLSDGTETWVSSGRRGGGSHIHGNTFWCQFRNATGKRKVQTPEKKLGPPLPQECCPPPPDRRHGSESRYFIPTFKIQSPNKS